jgi:hypothetical protein
MSVEAAETGTVVFPYGGLPQKTASKPVVTGLSPMSVVCVARGSRSNTTIMVLASCAPKMSCKAQCPLQGFVVT